jgi:ribosomal protein S18 acetylase RimI-like enzyme
MALLGRFAFPSPGGPADEGSPDPLDLDGVRPARAVSWLMAVVSAFGDGARSRYDAVVQDHDRVRGAAQFVPHWYLVLIGVDPAQQGLGLGSLLLRAGLSRVDQDGVECQLFTEQPRNVPLYQRYGFEIAVDGDLPDGGPHFWFMRWRPQALTA